ncbi:JAB domain-containing protein [Elizabethkingia anophelis]|uniref:JAB domain-containing protein n=1 Tax=Elizabethkingia anophelis TaxID=1117645 RepID=UPI002350D75F|nr:JAB domain-containing protein [Elizabethkingia anophelis]MDC8027518.1 JAB domain-containing protein [Elizabethkingia anophelis]
MNQAEQNIYGQNTNFGFPKNQETRYIKTSEGKELPYELFTNTGSNSGSSIIREETHSGYSTDFALVQRQYTENKQLSFIAGTKIQNINDVAWLFRSLEDEAIEHAFILYRFKDNSYMVQQLSSGGITGTVVDLRLVAGNAFALKPSSITLVHNHPSGNLVSSNEDRNILRKLQNIFEGSDIQVEDGIVINLRSGKYLVFNENEEGDRIKELKNQYEQQSNVSIYSFSKQIFSTNYQPQKITGPEDVAAFISTQKFGISDKTEALILNNNNEIVGKFILPQHKQFEKLVELMTVHAGAGTILYGNNISKAMFNDYNKRLSPIGFKLLDAILLQSNNYYSLVDNEIIKNPQYTEFKINNANEDPHIDFRVGEEDSSLKYANNNDQNTKDMNISSLNWVEKLLLHNTKAYKDFVKNISNHKEIKANSEQEKKFLEVYYNRELKKDNPNNFLFSARTLNEKKQTTQINNFLNGSETELFLKNIDFNNKAYLFKDIKHQNEIIISNSVLVSGILKELDDYKKEHGINHTGRFQDVEAAFLGLKSKQKKQTHNLESHPYSIAEGNWIKNQEKYTNLTPKYAVSILLQNNGEKKLSFVDNKNQSVIVIDNAAITQKVISDLYAKELENRTDLSKGLTNPQIDEKQALHYRNYETEARKLGIAITPHTGLEFNPIQVAQNKDFVLEDLKLTEWQQDNTSDIIDGFENIPEELEVVMEKWQQKIENGLDYEDCANFQKDCEDLGYTFDYGLDSVPFDLRKIDLKEHNINNQNSKIMTTQNKDFDQVKYLKDQLKYLQFGEGEKLHKDLEAGINSSEKEFQIKTSSDKTLPGNTIDFTLNYNKSEKGGIFLNSYLAELKNKKGEELSHIFNISKENTFDAKEAINLLEGRSVKIEFINPKIEEKQTAFVKLDFNEPKTEYGTYKFQSFHENYGVNTAEIVDKSGLIFDKPEWKDDTIKSLERGNIVNVKFKHEDKEIEGKAFLNPQYKTLNLYDSNMTRINTNKPLEGMGNDNAHDKSNVREQNRSRGI